MIYYLLYPLSENDSLSYLNVLAVDGRVGRYSSSR